MNILQIVLDPLEIIASDKLKIPFTATDKIFALVPTEKQRVQINGTTMFPLEIDYSKLSLAKKIVIKILFFLKFRGLLWNIISKECMNDLFDEIRSFDPEIIDLRNVRLSQKFKSALSLRYSGFTITRQNNQVHATPLGTSWRKYDPNIKVSIVLPVYNGENYLGKAIESCLQQTHKNIELIIVDDASIDNTPEIIAKYAQKDSRIISLRNKQNLKLPTSLNVGFSYTKGDLLTWTSADNYYDENAIKTLVQYLSTWPDVDFVYSAYYIIDSVGERDVLLPTVNYLPPPWQLPFGNTVGAYFLYRRKVYEKVGFYRADMEYMEDYEYWVRVYKSGFKMNRLHLPYYYYRRHEKSMTAAARNKGLDLFRKVQREHFPRK